MKKNIVHGRRSLSSTILKSNASDEHYAVYYPPRELAVHVPAYLSLLFALAPVLYMGLNMLSCRGSDGIDGMWDTRSGDDDDGDDDDDGGGDGGGGDADRHLSSGSLPAIRDEDVGTVNSRVSRRRRLLLLAGSARDRQ